MLKFLHRYNDKFVSTWLVLLMDLFIIVFAFIVATAIRFNLEFTYFDPSLFKYHLMVVCLVKVCAFLAYGTNVGIIRHTSFDDAKQLLKASLVGSGILLILTNVRQIPGIDFLNIPVSILLIDFFVSVFGLVASRILVKYFFEKIAVNFKSQRKVIIYGAGRLGLMTKSALSGGNLNNQHKILFFIDDNPQKVGKSIEGVKVFSPDQAKKIIKNVKYDDVELIFAIQAIEAERRSEITEEFLHLGLSMRIVPPMEQWMNGQLNPLQIAKIKIEDLLERPSIRLNNQLVSSFLAGKRVMITGAAGSIGSEIVRQVLKFNPEEVLLVDQAESPLYDLESELMRVDSNRIFRARIRVEVRNICNMSRMDKLFRRYRPQVVFHAAAYKHVPLMEGNPFKAVEVNTFGTQGLADLAVKYKAEKFVFVSTDKAVNPTNVMGASKRLAEVYVQSLNSLHNVETRFITTRFGNVLGSNGSVIPLFRKQIEKGGPVTVTHPDIIRFFMTIPEACQLVLEAGTMGKGGEIFVFDMGIPVKIVDLAEKMIRLSGFEPHTQIKIEYTGLRPGEKLFEELLGNEETTTPTHHPKIMIAKVRAQRFEDIRQEFGRIKAQLNELSNQEIVQFLKQMVPEYISNNSPFESLDEVPVEDMD
jgi:FlaA1/EpsC-like NDP-sugar epimerase